jgi:hypothetical protein
MLPAFVLNNSAHKMPRPPCLIGAKRSHLRNRTMDRKRLSQLCALPLALALLPGMAGAQAPEHANDEAPVELPADAPLDLSTPEPDAGKLTPSNPFAHTPPASDWAGKAGIDYSKPAIPAVTFQPGLS